MMQYSKKIKVIDDRIAKLKEQGLPVDDAVKEKGQLQALLSSKQKEIDSAVEQKQNLQKIADGYNGKFNLGEMDSIVQELVRPLLDSLESIGSIGSKTEISNNSFDINVYFAK